VVAAALTGPARAGDPVSRALPEASAMVAARGRVRRGMGAPRSISSYRE
jgi:hypothetical protein